MQRSAQVAKAMRQMCPPQRLLYVMSRHQVALTGGPYYTDEELRALKLKHISLHYYPNHKDISHIGSAICDSAVVDDEKNPRVQEEAIKKG
jgi:hypothetical protein